MVDHFLPFTSGRLRSHGVTLSFNLGSSHPVLVLQLSFLLLLQLSLRLLLQLSFLLLLQLSFLLLYPFSFLRNLLRLIFLILFLFVLSSSSFPYPSHPYSCSSSSATSYRSLSIQKCFFVILLFFLFFSSVIFLFSLFFVFILHLPVSSGCYISSTCSSSFSSCVLPNPHPPLLRLFSY